MISLAESTGVPSNSLPILDTRRCPPLFTMPRGNSPHGPDAVVADAVVSGPPPSQLPHGMAFAGAVSKSAEQEPRWLGACKLIAGGGGADDEEGPLFPGETECTFRGTPRELE